MIGEYIKLKSDVRSNSSVTINDIGIEGHKTRFPYKAVVVARNNEMCNLEGRLATQSFDLGVTFNNNESYTVKFFEQSNNIETIKSVVSMVGQMVKEKSTDALYNTMEPKIFDASNNQVGEFKYIAVNNGGLQSYSYNQLVLNGVILNVYLVGEGKNELYLCMYTSNDEMVATVKKVLPVKNGKSRYTMYMVNDQWFKYVTLATSIVHQTIFEGDTIEKDGIGLGSSSQALNSFQQGLKEKYNPNFIQSIIDKEGPNNLPENMPLVEQKVYESQHTAGLTLQRIWLIVFLVGFGILFIILIFGRK